MNKLVSIIIPCYNQSQYLSEALLSVLEQTYANWECIIVNDGSPDHTEEVVQEWLAKDSRFQYYKKENGGVSSARNFGLEKSQGDFIQFLDADDVIALDKIAVSITAVQENGVDVVCSNYLLFEKSILHTKPSFSDLGNFDFTFYNLARYWNDGFTVPIHCWFFKASLFKNSQFPVGLTAQEDWVVWLTVFQKAPKTFYINRALAFYRANSQGRTKVQGFFEETLQAIHYLKPILNETDFQLLYEATISRYNAKMLYCRNKEMILKRSNSYQTGLLIKKILKTLGILGLSRKIFPYILRLKSK